MEDLKLDTYKLKNFPAIELALGWISAAHDYDSILEIEGLLRKQEAIDEDLQLPAYYSLYLSRLRVAQTREALGLCNRIKDVPELCELINRDQEAVASFDRLHTMNLESNQDMETIRLMRDTIFHYSMRQHKDWYQSAFDQLIAKGNTVLSVNTGTPHRFSPADDLLIQLFLSEVLQMPDLTDPEASGARMTQVVEMLVEVGYDFQVVARAIGRGLIEACQL